MEHAQDRVRRLTQERVQRHRLRLTEERRKHSKIEKQGDFAASMSNLRRGTPSVKFKIAHE